MKDEEIPLWLEKIKCGSVLEELKIYDELSDLSGHKRRIVDATIYLNERGILPKISHLEEKTYINETSLRYPLSKLKNLNLVFDASIPDMISVFGILKGHSLILPDELDKATFHEAKNYRNKRGNSKSWGKKIEGSRAKCYSRYYISLVSKDGKFPSRKAFSFLNYLKYEPKVVV